MTNQEKIEQCKADIKVLEANLAKLQEKIPVVRMAWRCSLPQRRLMLKIDNLEELLRQHRDHEFITIHRQGNKWTKLDLDSQYYVTGNYYNGVENVEGFDDE